MQHDYAKAHEESLRKPDEQLFGEEPSMPLQLALARAYTIMCKP
jgi:hypothetical protein